MKTTKTGTVVDHVPTGRTAECPVCDQYLITVRRRTTTVQGRIDVDDTDLFPTHQVPGRSHDCCESLDPVADADYRRAIRHARLEARAS